MKTLTGGNEDRPEAPIERYAQIALILTLAILGIAIAYYLGLYLMTH